MCRRRNAKADERVALAVYERFDRCRQIGLVQYLAVAPVLVGEYSMVVLNDNLERTGLRTGMLSILVMSGETTEAMLAASPTRPDLKFGRLADMIPLL